MKIIYFILAVMLLVACLFYGCCESTESSNVSKRLLYYYVADPYQVILDDAVYTLYSYDLVNDEVKEVTKNKILYTTGISKNGTLICENNRYSTPICCLVLFNGKASPIQMPQSTDSNMKFTYSHPSVQMSYNGKFAFLFVSYVSVQYGTGSVQKLIFLDLSSHKRILFDIQNSCINKFSSPNINEFYSGGRRMILNNEGTSAWFVLTGYNRDDIKFKNIEARIFKFNNGNLQPISRIIKDDITIIGADYLNERIFACAYGETTVFASDNYNDSIPVNIPYENFSNPEQFAKEKSEMACWTDDGIAIYDLNTMTVKNIVINWSRIDSLYPGLAHQKNRRLSISPDGEYVTFALPTISPNYSFDLFVIKRDGSEFKRIVKNAPVGISVVSGVIQ